MNSRPTRHHVGFVFLLAIALVAGAWLVNGSRHEPAAAAGQQLLFYHVDRSAVPSWIRDADTTFLVSVGMADVITVVADGQAIPYDYDLASGQVAFTTAGSELAIYVGSQSAPAEEIGEITVAPLRDNKRWAYSLTMDDGFLNQRTIGTRYLGRFGYRAASAVEGHWMDEDGSEWGYMQPDDVRALRAAGWSIFNHSYAHFSADAIADHLGDVQRAQQVLARELDGYVPLAFTVPRAEDTNPGYGTAIDANADQLGIHLVQENGENLEARTNVASPLTYAVDVLHIGRDTVENAESHFAKAHDSPAPVWLSLHTHGVLDTCRPQRNGGTWETQEWVGSTTEHLYQTYGAAGTDEVWVAPADEVLQYLVLRDHITVTRTFPGAPPTLELQPVTRTKTLFLQEGKAGYAGTLAAKIDAWHQTTPAAAQLTLRAERVYNGLLRFELPSLPPGAQISRAALSVYALDHSNSNVVWVEAYPLRRNWLPDEATWLQAATDNAWGEPGAADPENDRAPEPTDRRGFQQCSDTPGEWYTLDVSAAVRDWATKPASNHGLLLEATSTSTEIALASPTYWDVALRPKLLVTYSYPEQPFWPVLTPTATSTATPSATPSATPTATQSPTPTATATPVPGPFSHLPSLSDRFGVGVNGSYGHIEDYDVASLKTGWYSNWKTGVAPALPGLDYVQVIAAKPSAYPPDWASLATAVHINADTLWIVGNEPEGVYGQGERTPAEYARIYHDLYTFIKNIDPDAVVAIGGVIEPTPLRLQWLDQVLANYQSLFGEPMPVDVWNIHVQILQEQRGGWGAAIPAGLPDDHGRLYSAQDNADPNIFRTLVQEFRQWMKARGFQDKPLIISEYGVLMPYCFLADEPDCAQDLNASVSGRQQVKDFMTQTFAFLLNSKDSTVGYPKDEGRLVQRWLWYSLNEKPYDVNTGLGFSGGLFDWQTGEMTEFGQVFSDTVVPLATPYVDLTLRGFEVSPDTVTPGQPVTFTLHARVANRGETPAANMRVRFWDSDPDAGGQQIGSDQIIGETLWRYGPGADVTITWPNQTLGPGQTLAIYAAVDPDDSVVEALEDNNRLRRRVWAPHVHIFLPLIRR